MEGGDRRDKAEDGGIIKGEKAEVEIMATAIQGLEVEQKSVPTTGPRDDSAFGKFLEAALTVLPVQIETVALYVGVGPERLVGILDGSICPTRSDILLVCGGLRPLAFEILCQVHAMPEAEQAALRPYVFAMLPLAEVLDRVQEIIDERAERTTSGGRVN